MDLIIPKEAKETKRIYQEWNPISGMFEDHEEVTLTWSEGGRTRSAVMLKPDSEVKERIPPITMSRKINDEVIEDIDVEIVDLCVALNKVEGIRTTCSCFGHGRYPISIFCKASSINLLNRFLWAFCWRYGCIGCGAKPQGWTLGLCNHDTDNRSTELEFCISSDLARTQEDCDKLARKIESYVQDDKDGKFAQFY